MSERLNQDAGFDVLGDILETLRFRGSVFFRSDLAAPWGMSLTEMGVPRFHIMLSGECFVGSDDHDAVKAKEADIVMLPNGDSHWIADMPDRELVPSAKAGKACELGNPLFQKGTITKAHSLVKYSSTSFELIADATGFASARTLSRAFQRRYDCTPSELRRAQNAG